jgi:hypothetical protein
LRIGDEATFDFDLSQAFCETALPSFGGEILITECCSGPPAATSLLLSEIICFLDAV